jgi:hypothetical protein
MSTFPVIDVVEVTHPGSVWAWSSEAKLRWLRARYGTALRWRRVYADGTSDIETDEGLGGADAHVLALLDVAGQTCAPVPARGIAGARADRFTTQIAKAAELQGPQIGERVLRRLRETVFVAGDPVATSDRVRDAVDGVGYLDFDRLLCDARSDAVAAALLADRAEAGRIGAEAALAPGERPRLPIVVVDGPDGRRALAGWHPTVAYDDAVRAAALAIVPDGVLPLTPADALDRFRSLTLAELELLTGSLIPPLDSVPVVTATSPLFVHPDDADARAYAGSLAQRVGT